MPKLRVILGGNEVTHELGEEAITIGRIDDNMIQIDDPSVSSHHAQLTQKDGDYLLKDLGSTNGTRVNNKTFVEWQLEDGDRIRFGNVEAIYGSDVPSATQPLPAAAEAPVVPAASSHRPSDFANASPFRTKKKTRDPLGAATIALAVVSILTFAFAVFNVLSLQPPQ